MFYGDINIMEDRFFLDGEPIRHIRRDIDHILRSWLYEPNCATARLIRAADGRSLLQMRIDLGVIQMETHFRPDGTRPGGFKTYFRMLRAKATGSNGMFVLSGEHYAELVRELKQFDYRRICWLALKRYPAAVKDADHSLGILNFIRDYSPLVHWSQEQEILRPFLTFHRIYAATMAILQNSSPEIAIRELNKGIETLKETIRMNLELFKKSKPDDETERFTTQLVDLKHSIRKEHNLNLSLEEQLENAIFEEDYERAAKIRDKISSKFLDIP